MPTADQIPTDQKSDLKSDLKKKREDQIRSKMAKTKGNKIFFALHLTFDGDRL